MTRARSSPRNPVALQCALVAFTLSAALLLRVQWSVGGIAAFLVAINLTTLIAYGYDKWAAPRDGRRMPERSLHLLAAVGGSPAALLAQYVFRHKTRKRPFVVRFWLIVAGQVIVLAAWWRWHSPG